MSDTAPRVAVLGPVSVAGADALGTLARALLVALAVGGARAGEVRSHAALADDVWGDDLPQNPRGALQTLVSRVRAAAGTDLVVSSAAGYALGVAGDDIDLGRAHHLAAQADARDPGDPARLELVQSALALWRGEPGADLGSAPIARELADTAAALRERLVASRAHALVAQGRAGEAVSAFEDLASARPFDEAAHRSLMEALAADGRTQEALAVFATLRARLRDELGASPSPPTVELNARLLREQPGEGTRIRIGLRAAPNELIGRDDDLHAVADGLRRSRAVTVLGAGGLGKTRLVQAVAAASDLPFVAVVELASVRADDDVLPAIATTLGISESTPGGRLSDARQRPDLRTRVLALLSERAGLLVLDNCEQVIDGVARWAADALASAPSLRLLTTSRTPLAIAGESVYPLAPLASADQGPAVELFLERARAVRPGATLPADVVARLCEHLDGLPLAIELAAARVRTMTPEQIEHRLKDRFALLTTGDRTAPERHRTLEAVISWSWDLLDADARAALATLAVLPAGFSAATAAGVLLELSADDLLDRLVAQSLLVVSEDARTGEMRFRMLETVREFGMARLVAEGREDAAWEAVFGWARAYAADRASRVFEVEVFREVRAEHDNLLAVLRRAIGLEQHADTVLLFALLSQMWIARGSISEMEAFAEPVFAALPRVGDDDVPADVLVPVLVLSAFVLMFTEDSRVLRTLARLRVLRRRHPELRPLPGALADIVGAATTPARMAAELERLRADDDPHVALIGELVTAQVSENQGDLETAMVAAYRAWETADGLGEDWAAAMAASSYGQLASQSGRPEEALAWIELATDGFALFGAEDELRQQGWLRGSNLLSLGRLDEARALFRELAELRELTPDGLELASIGWFGLAETARAEGDATAAVERYLKAMKWFRTNDQRGSPWYLMAMAGLVSATTFDGSLPAPAIERWAARLRSRAIATLRIRPDFDRPVLGTVLCGWSAWALSVAELRDRGLEALVLSEAMGGRQDLPSLHLDEHLAHAASLCGEDAVSAARATASALTVEERTRRAVAALTEPLR